MNLCLLITGFVLFWLQRLLYGPLRPAETEQLYERAWFAVTETCLAMTIFRGELGGWFLVMFVSLLVGKIWGWIGEGRIEFLEQQQPTNQKLFHLRLAVSLILTVSFDGLMLRYCVNTVITQARPDMMVMFGFEFAILAVLSSSSLLRYVIALTEISITRQQVRAKVEERRAEIRVARVEAIRASAREGATSPPANLPDESDVDELEIDVPGWEEKGRWIFYLDLATDLLKLVIYLSFFGILLTFYGLPIHILRDVVVTIRSFARRIVDFMRYRNATRDMNERYPDATAEELSREDVCIICREEMIPVQPTQPADGGAADPAAPAAPAAAGTQRVPDRLRPKKLPCGHILHFGCLRSWLERQQNCPTCRRPVLASSRTAGAAGGGGNNVPGQQNGNQANRQGGDGQPRARIYQFGPFRVGFGAVRGDVFNNMHRQIQQGNAPQPAANPPANIPPEQIGVGRHPQAPNGTPPYVTASGVSTASDISAQLLQIEQRIHHEIQALLAVGQQVNRVRQLRQLQLELDRLRQQTNPIVQSDSPGNSSSPTTGPAASVFATRQQFVAYPNASVMSSGDSRLPEGISLPPGWTLLPLQRIENGARVVQSEQAAQLTQLTPIITTGTYSTTPAASNTTAQTPAVPAPFQDETKDTGVNTKTTLDSFTSSTDPVSSTEHRADSPSHEWTDLAPKESLEADSTIPTTWGSGETLENASSRAYEPIGPSSKGKGRAVTVEDTADEEASG